MALVSLTLILAFAAVAYTTVAVVLEPLTRARITLSVLVNATIEARLVLCVARNLVLPADAGTVFVPLGAETRHYLYIWTRRFILWAVFGYAVPRAAWWLGVPGAIYGLLLDPAASGRRMQHFLGVHRRLDLRCGRPAAGTPGDNALGVNAPACHSACNIGSDAILVRRRLLCTD